MLNDTKSKIDALILEAGELSYDKPNRLASIDGLKGKIELLIRRRFGNNNTYQNTLQSIEFFHITSAPQDERFIRYFFNKGVLDVINLLHVLRDDLEYSDQEFAIEHNKSQKEKKFEEVFIVHGRDNSAKNEVARFVEKLGFKPIILHEQVNEGKTIIEKIEKFSDVGFAIVLYTPCDVGGLNEPSPKLQERARQNVVLEHGYLIGKLGRANVSALVKGNIELPNDISGMVYTALDDLGAWKLSVVAEMKTCGYKVDLNKLHERSH